VEIRSFPAERICRNHLLRLEVRVTDGAAQFDLLKPRHGPLLLLGLLRTELKGKKRASRSAFFQVSGSIRQYAPYARRTVMRATRNTRTTPVRLLFDFPVAAIIPRPTRLLLGAPVRVTGSTSPLAGRFPVEC
jgi:hypothetical protein